MAQPSRETRFACFHCHIYVVNGISVTDYYELALYPIRRLTNRDFQPFIELTFIACFEHPTIKMNNTQRERCEKISPDCPLEDTIYGYVPNMGGNAFFGVVFGICTLVQVYFLFRYWRFWKGYTILVLIGSLLECCGYAGRILMSKNPWDGAATSIQFVLLMVGPSFLAAALYMTLRALVQYFGEQYTKLPARLWTWPFVTADMLGFFSQCVGGVMASMTEKYPSLGTVGRVIMVFGVTFQAVVMAIAGILAADFALRMRRVRGSVFRHLPKDLNIFLISLTVVFLLVLTRCIYRIPELAGGVGGHMMRQEVEFMILDGCMIAISVILLSVIHPGIYATAIHGHADHRSKSVRLMDLESSASRDGSGRAPSDRPRRGHSSRSLRSPSNRSRRSPSGRYKPRREHRRHPSDY